MQKKPVNSTACYDKGCKFYEQVYSPQPGESWNRCSCKNRCIRGMFSKFHKSINYGYAEGICEFYEEKINIKKISKYAIKEFFQPIKFLFNLFFRGKP